jgi:hypothetical protein
VRVPAIGVERVSKGALNVCIAVAVLCARTGVGTGPGIGLALQGQIVRMASINSNTAEDDKKVI